MVISTATTTWFQCCDQEQWRSHMTISVSFPLCLCVSHSICLSLQWQQILLSLFCIGRKEVHKRHLFCSFCYCFHFLVLSPGRTKDQFSSLNPLLVSARRPFSQHGRLFFFAASCCLVKLAPMAWRAFLCWSFLGSLHVWYRPSSSLLCLLNSKTRRPQTDVGSLWGSPFPPERNPFHEE